MFYIKGLKLAKRTPVFDYKTGEMIDDGVNKQIILCSSEHEDIVDFFFKSIKSRIHGKSWKIWKE